MAEKLTAQDVKGIRQVREWSTYELAQHLGCNQSTVWRMENGGHISGPAEKLLRALMLFPPQAPRPRREATL